MSDKIIRDKMIETLGTSILNQLNLNGLIEAAKNYSIQLANTELDKMSDEDKEKLIEHIEKADAEATEGKSGESEEVEVAETEVVA
jgi:transcriptional regulator of aromatic amino acid metabolism